MLNDKPITTTLSLESRGLVVSLRVSLPAAQVAVVHESGLFDVQNGAEEALPGALLKVGPPLLQQLLLEAEKSLMDRCSDDAALANRLPEYLKSMIVSGERHGQPTQPPANG